MSEFAPICIYLVISPLVSLIPLGLPFLFSSNSSTYPEKLSAYECGFDPSGDARSRFENRLLSLAKESEASKVSLACTSPFCLPTNKSNR
ncbi:NADH-ubiquinone oxidoreductase chain 3 [Capsicum annuum]|uniref:NADH-ubiquinone oxidoreductase chain 3 n=1 Tax=Capsicum annuum TaxID=4072 RepID=A0A2G2YKE0_CAPAN|nr:NADH-ubiquinone oxidoreductase chain 3 [Capsicum annuum]